MTDWIALDDWILLRQEQAKQRDDPKWHIPDNTMALKDGIEQDLETLAFQLGVTLKIVVQTQ